MSKWSSHLVTLILGKVILAGSSSFKMFFKCADPGLFLFISGLFKHKFYSINCRLQWDLNSDCQNKRQACLPLDHHHYGPVLSKSYYRHLILIVFWDLHLQDKCLIKPNLLAHICRVKLFNSFTPFCHPLWQEVLS